MKHKIADVADADVRQARKKRRSMGVVRATRYHLLKILRLRASPHAIAIGVAAGIAAAFLPFIGVHIAISVTLAWLMGGNVLAATAGTLLVGNPFTYPFIWAATWEAGQVILGHGAVTATRINLHELFHKMDFSMIWGPILKPMLVGSIPLSIACGFVGYIVMYQAVKVFRARRQARMSGR
jgi:uncharacterized protein